MALANGLGPRGVVREQLVVTLYVGHLEPSPFAWSDVIRAILRWSYPIGGPFVG